MAFGGWVLELKINMAFTTLIQITANYSNAVLVAILPHVSDCAKKLDLPIQQPIDFAQISCFHPMPYQGEIGGTVALTNQYSFFFSSGYVNSFHSPNDWLANTNDDWTDVEYFKRYLGKDSITTNKAIELARDAFKKLGYNPDEFQLHRPPTRFQGPSDVERIGGHIPYCLVEWDSPESKIQSILGLEFSVQFDVDMQHRQIVGMALSGRRFFRPNPKVSAVPEIETDYQRAGAFGQLAQMRDKIPSIHITPAYSNATLTATLPYVSDFAAKLGLPVSHPLTSGQVVFYQPPAYYNDGFNCRLMLTNHPWFSFVAGYVYEFGSPDDWFEEQATRTDWPIYSIKTCMTTNEAIDFARGCIGKLGYAPEALHMNMTPSAFENASDSGNRQFAYCRIHWDNPEENPQDDYHLEFDIDMQARQLVGVSLISKKFFRPLPKIDVPLELESDYRKRVQGHVFFRTNAVSHLPAVKPADAHPVIPSE
jgi:hypothetical protein